MIWWANQSWRFHILRNQDKSGSPSNFKHRLVILFRLLTTLSFKKTNPNTFSTHHTTPTLQTFWNKSHLILSGVQFHLQPIFILNFTDLRTQKSIKLELCITEFLFQLRIAKVRNIVMHLIGWLEWVLSCTKVIWKKLAIEKLDNWL